MSLKMRIEIHWAEKMMKGNVTKWSESHRENGTKQVIKDKTRFAKNKKILHRGNEGQNQIRKEEKSPSILNMKDKSKCL